MMIRGTLNTMDGMQLHGLLQTTLEHHGAARNRMVLQHQTLHEVEVKPKVKARIKEKTKAKAETKT